VGSWTAAYELGQGDAMKNVVNAKHVTVSESTGNYISSKSGKMISLVGLEGFAVVETESAILICKLDKAQNVKEIVDQLKSKEELNRFL
jgi:mannose-1-phosphate guanylyltransferase